MNKITIGVKEWADHSINLYSGCSNNCKYCYSKKMAIRFNRKTEGTWKIMDLNHKAVLKEYRNRNGRIMFPTSHDITSESFEYCLIVLRKLLKVGNEVLITTKPDPVLIFNIMDQIEEFKDQVQFRFTITSTSNNLLKFWEPNAPTFQERLIALKLAFRKGFKTSVSIEPYLDQSPIPLIYLVAPDTSDTIWIGIMNYIDRSEIRPENERYYTFQRKIVSWTNIQKIITELKQFPEEVKSKIRIKDSIRTKCEKHNYKLGVTI